MKTRIKIAGLLLFFTPLIVAGASITLPANQWVPVSPAYYSAFEEISNIFPNVVIGTYVRLWSTDVQGWRTFARAPRSGWGLQGTNRVPPGCGLFINSPTQATVTIGSGSSSSPWTSIGINKVQGYNFIAYPYSNVVFQSTELAKTAATGDKISLRDDSNTNSVWVTYSKLRQGWSSGATNLILQNGSAFFYLSYTNSTVYEVQP